VDAPLRVHLRHNPDLGHAPLHLVLLRLLLIRQRLELGGEEQELLISLRSKRSVKKGELMGTAATLTVRNRRQESGIESNTFWNDNSVLS